MGILKIAKMGHPVLARVASPVADPKSQEIRSLIDDMYETMIDAPGIGLAAPQVHESVRIVIFKIPIDRGDDKALGSLTILINPIIEILSEKRDMGVEGCLSLPGMAGLVPRYTHIRYTGIDGHGKKIEREAKDYHARVVQHECDHLDGLLYPMRMTNLSSFGYVEEIHKQNIGNIPEGEDNE